MKKINVTDEDYSCLIKATILVPRNIVKAKVGSNYLIVSPSNTTGIEVRCSQNCPIAFAINSPDE